MRGDRQLVVPDEIIENPNKKMWYEKYPKLSSSKFTFENSGNKANEASPFAEKRVNNEIVDIEGLYGMDKTYKVIGYTENPPFQPYGYHAVAIMFEHQHTFETIWFHYRSGKNVDVSEFGPEYFGDVEKLRFEYDQKWRDSEYDEYYENEPHTSCPKCGRSYDDIGYDFQYCKACGWDSENEVWLNPTKPTDADVECGEADFNGRWI